MSLEVIYEPSSESAVLSCLCHAPPSDQREILLSIKEDHFYLQENKVIFRAIMRCIARGLQADILNVKAEIEAASEVDVIGGETKIVEVATACTAHNNWKRYYPKLEEARYRRSLEYLANEMVHKARDRELKIEELKNWSETSVMKADYEVDDSGKLSITQALDRAAQNIESSIAGKPVIGVRTGLAPLDDILMFGLRGGDMVVLAARPSVGKTASALQIAEDVALNQHKRVLIFSLEMTSVALMERMIRSRARVGAADILAGRITPSQQKELGRAVNEIQTSEIICDDSSAKSIGYLKAVARRAHQRTPLDLIIIDYLQLVKGDSKRGKENRVCEVEEISGGVKDLAKTLKVPVVVLAQLNRDHEKRTSRPGLSDLKGSGAIEQDADIVILLHSEDPQEAIPNMEFIVAKHRDGPTDIARMAFNKPITRFENC